MESLLLKNWCADSLTLALSPQRAIWKVPRPYVKEIHLLILKHLPEGHKLAETLSRAGRASGWHLCALNLLAPASSWCHRSPARGSRWVLYPLVSLPQSSWRWWASASPLLYAPVTSLEVVGEYPASPTDPQSQWAHAMHTEYAPWTRDSHGWADCVSEPTVLKQRETSRDSQVPVQG